MAWLRGLAGPFFLAAVLGTIALALPWYQVVPNRVAPGVSWFLADGGPALWFGWSVLLAVLVLASSRSQAGPWLAAASLAFCCLLWWQPALLFPDAGLPGASERVRPAAAFWLFHLVLAGRLALRPFGRAQKLAAGFVGLVFVLSALFTPLLHPLALFKEAQQQSLRLAAELGQHLFLSVGATLAALLLGLPLGVAASKRSWGGFITQAAATVQTIPSLALFGFLMIPLALLSQAWPELRRLGISGIGAAPALIALSLYAVLPLLLAVQTGLRQVPRASLEAARGMGFRPSQILFRVELPLAWPQIFSGLRVSFLQTLGNAALVPLIGAGGLGFFIFQGLGQTAPDMVLLGVLPLVSLALISDALLSWGEKRLARKNGEGS